MGFLAGLALGLAFGVIVLYFENRRINRLEKDVENWRRYGAYHQYLPGNSEKWPIK